MQDEIEALLRDIRNRDKDSVVLTLKRTPLTEPAGVFFQTGNMLFLCSSIEDLVWMVAVAREAGAVESPEVTQLAIGFQLLVGNMFSDSSSEKLTTFYEELRKAMAIFPKEQDSFRRLVIETYLKRRARFLETKARLESDGYKEPPGYG